MKRLVIALVSLSLGAITGCSHNDIDKRIDDKLAAEPSVGNREALHSEADRLIDAATDLSAAQKAQLKNLGDRTRARTDELVRESLKLRSLLVKDVMSPQYDVTEVRGLQHRLKANSEERLNLLFEAVEKANVILGRNASAHQKLVQSFFDPENARIY